MSEELKACPFDCGGIAEVRQVSDGGYVLEHAHLTTEPDCICSLAAWYPTKAEAIAAWNRRPSPEAGWISVGSGEAPLVDGQRYETLAEAPTAVWQYNGERKGWFDQKPTIMSLRIVMVRPLPAGPEGEDPCRHCGQQPVFNEGLCGSCYGDQFAGGEGHEGA